MKILITGAGGKPDTPPSPISHSPSEKASWASSSQSAS